ncbi:MAG: AAA family ATPase [Muribaculaceae bacterium]|nr:AAA family ATPase [Muribaculaceae bacterium]
MKNQLISSDSFSQSAKDTIYLRPGLWREKTTMLLHASQNVDKTGEAIEIAASISLTGRKIVFVNAADTLHNHADKLAGINNMSILNPSLESADDSTDYADLIINAIEEVIAETDIRVFIIDSVSRIAALSFGRNASAAYVMKRLVNLQMRCGCSFLIIANDSTKSADRALINLATSEYKLQQTPLSENTSDNSECKADSVAAETPETPESPVVPVSRRQMSRRDRRILRREAQKQGRS